VLIGISLLRGVAAGAAAKRKRFMRVFLLWAVLLRGVIDARTPCDNPGLKSLHKDENGPMRAVMQLTTAPAPTADVASRANCLPSRTPSKGSGSG